MSESNDFLADLVATEPEFTKEMTVQVAAKGGAEREVKFKATMRLLPLDEWDDLKADATVHGVVEKCLVKIEGVPSATVNGETLTPEQVALRVTDICSRLFGELEIRHSRESRNTVLSSYERGNSKRSRRR
jgi:hypothetical protein